MNLSRREVLASLTVCGACAALGICPTEAFAGGPKAIDLGPVTDFADEGIYDKFAKTHRLLLVRTGDTLTAMSSLCTHRNAVLVKKGDHLRCAKHGSEFDAAGYVLKAPARISLPRCGIRIENGKVIVDPSKMFDEKNWGDPAASVTIQQNDLKTTTQPAK